MRNLVSKYINKYVLILIGLFCFLNQAKSQNIDSLKTVLSSEKDPIKKIVMLGKIASNCEFNEIEEYSNQSLDLISKLSPIQRKENDNKLIVEEARAYNNLSFYFFKLSLYPKAEDFSMKSILMLEKSHLDTSLLVSSYNNLATVYLALKSYEKAISILNKNLKYDVISKNMEDIALDYNNISFAYSGLNKNDSAIYYAKKSISIKEGLENKSDLINSYKLLGAIYLDNNAIDSASFYINKGFNYAIELNELDSYGLVYYWKGLVEQKLGNAKVAEDYFLKSLQYQKNAGNLELIYNANLELYRLYNNQKKYDKALYHFQQYKIFQDSAISTKINQESSIKQVKFEYSLKENELLDKQEKENALSEEKQNKQKLIILFISLGIIVSIVFLIFALNRARLLKKQKNFISEQRDLLSTQQQELIQKNDLLDKKNTTIAENINYALDIQSSLMPTEEKISRLINKDCFVLFQPKDVVSGDFYWTFSKNNKQLVVLADCTGHGVTGAFISILAIKSLEKVASEIELNNLQVILKKLHEDFLNTFGENINSDFGIELVMCCFEGNKMSITGSSNSVCLVKNNELTTYTFDSISIGTKEAKLDGITIQQIDSVENSSVYLFTDGYIDQKGGPNNKRYLSKNLKEDFVKISTLPIKQQKDTLVKNYTNWKGSNEQMDDVSIIGIKC